MIMALDLSKLNEIDLKNLDLKDLARAPAAVKAVFALILFLFVVGAGYFLLWSDRLAAIEAKQREERNLRESYTSKKRQAIHYEAYKKRLEDTDKALAAMLRQLPDKAEMDALLTDINQTGIGRGLEFQLFRPEPEKPGDFYVTLPVTIKVVGSYHDIAYFVSDIARLSRIVTLHDVNIVPVQGKEEALVMDAVINTYRYQDAQPPAKADKKGTKRGEKK